MRTREYNPGDVWCDRSPAGDCFRTYVLLSADRECESAPNVWRVARFGSFGSSLARNWMGAPVVDMLEFYFARLRKVGRIPIGHTIIPEVKLRFAHWWKFGFKLGIRIRYLDIKYGKPFHEQKKFWEDLNSE